MLGIKGKVRGKPYRGDASGRETETRRRIDETRAREQRNHAAHRGGIGAEASRYFRHGSLRPCQPHPLFWFRERRHLRRAGVLIRRFPAQKRRNRRRERHIVACSIPCMPPRIIPTFAHKRASRGLVSETRPLMAPAPLYHLHRVARRSFDRHLPHRAQPLLRSLHFQAQLDNPLSRYRLLPSAALRH